MWKILVLVEILSFFFYKRKNFFFSVKILGCQFRFPPSQKKVFMGNFENNYFSNILYKWFTFSDQLYCNVLGKQPPTCLNNPATLHLYGNLSPQRALPTEPQKCSYLWRGAYNVLHTIWEGKEKRFLAKNTGSNAGMYEKPQTEAIKEWGVGSLVATQNPFCRGSSKGSTGPVCCTVLSVLHPA